jgi:hypothetical protein
MLVEVSILAPKILDSQVKKSERREILSIPPDYKGFGLKWSWTWLKI